MLARLLLNASRDEAGHAREFIHYTADRLASEPERAALGAGDPVRVHGRRGDQAPGEHLQVRAAASSRDPETIDTGFELFLEKVADAGELDGLQAKIRRTFGSLTGRDLSTNARVRRALAEAIA